MDVVEAQNHDLIVEFVDEAIDSLRGLPEQLEAYRADPAQAEAINVVFRAVHSVKGCAAFMGLNDIKIFAHALENTLDDVRNEVVALGEDLQRSLVDGIDLLESMLNAAGEGQSLDAFTAQVEQTLARVQELAAQARLDESPEEHLLADLRHVAQEIAALGLPGGDEMASRLRQMVTTYMDASSDDPVDEEADTAEPTSTPAAMRGGEFRLGEKDISADVELLLDLFAACREDRYADDVVAAFIEAAARLASIGRENADATLADAVEGAADDLRTVHESPVDMDEGMQSILWDRLQPELERLWVRPEPPADQADSASPETLPADTDPAGSTSLDTPADATPGAAPPAASPEKRPRFLRVREERVEEFLEEVSRLFITVELFKELHGRMAAANRIPELVEEMRNINRDLQIQSSKLQQGVVALRLVAISGALSKLPRMARTLASQLGKTIDVHLSGEETEIDKSLAEDLDAPLNHLVRNVVDHALETPEERQSAGKPAAGNLWVSAEQVRNRIHIAIRDDGRGIDPAKMRAKAVEKGLITQEEADGLSEEDSYKLIFRPGFSTAEQISDVSGRGVGMDVVRTTLAEHKGEVRVESTLGQGTTVHLEIPIKQAVLVIDGLLIEHAEQQFIVPFDHVQEITTVKLGEMKYVQGRSVAVVRGKPYDAVSLSEAVGLPESDLRQREEADALVLECKQGALCLMIDRVIGHRQAVVNSIKGIIDTTDKIAGVSPTGGGRLALVLHVPELVQIG